MLNTFGANLEQINKNSPLSNLRGLFTCFGRKSMTGHVEGSRAFSRYHTIEEEVKKSLVDILR